MGCGSVIAFGFLLQRWDRIGSTGGFVVSSSFDREFAATVGWVGSTDFGSVICVLIGNLRQRWDGLGLGSRGARPRVWLCNRLTKASSQRK